MYHAPFSFLLLFLLLDNSPSRDLSFTLNIIRLERSSYPYKLTPYFAPPLVPELPKTPHIPHSIPHMTSLKRLGLPLGLASSMSNPNFPSLQPL